MRRFLRLLRPSTAGEITVCERCAQACGPACRSATALDRARTHALHRTRLLP